LEKNGWSTNFFLSFGGYPDTSVLEGAIVHLEAAWGISSSKRVEGMRFEIEMKVISEERCR
jgi:hypothetical protein